MWSRKAHQSLSFNPHSIQLPYQHHLYPQRNYVLRLRRRLSSPIEHNKRKNPTTNLTDTFNQIDEWCTHSGSVLSKDKCQILYIWRKHNCNAKILTGDTIIPATDTLKILGLTINNRYKWNSNISKWKTDLSKPLGTPTPLLSSNS